MRSSIYLVALAAFQGALGHGGHENTGPASGETIQQYAKRHVCRYLSFIDAHFNGANKVTFRCPQNITCNPFNHSQWLEPDNSFQSDSFDIRSFFKLHDLDK